MRLNYNNILTTLVGAGLCLGVASAQAGYLLSEDFDDGAASYNFSGFVSSAATGSLPSVNIRPITDAIYTNRANGFSLASPAALGVPGFSGSFLVLGDYVNLIANGTAPSGPAGSGTSPSGGQTSMATFNLGTFGSGLHSLDISFDYVFDTSLAPGTGTAPARSSDDFFVRLMAGAVQIAPDLVFFDDVSQSEASRRGQYSESVSFNLSGPSTMVSLAFGVKEFNGTGDSAAGIDNLRVVPEPTSIALLGAGLLGLVGARKRRAKSA
jgi:hypothetical protein